MAITDMVFTPATGLNDVSYSKQIPDSEASIRAQIQGISDQLKNYINNTLHSSVITLSGSENIGSAPINGVAGSTVYAQLVALKGVVDAMVLGAIPLNSISISQLDFTPLVTADKTALQASIDTNTVGIKINKYRSYMGV